MDERDGRVPMLEGIRDLLSECDIAVSYNGVSFDTKKLNGELMSERVLPPAPYKEVDLYKVFKRNATLYSGKLDYVASRTIGQQKVETGGFQLWKDVMANDPVAWRKMLRYQRKDVNLLVDLLDEFRPWIKFPHPVSDGDDKCRNCGSEDLERRGYALAFNSRYQRFRCNGCGSWSRSNKRVASTNVSNIA